MPIYFSVPVAAAIRVICNAKRTQCISVMAVTCASVHFCRVPCWLSRWHEKQFRHRHEILSVATPHLVFHYSDPSVVLAETTSSSLTATFLQPAAFGDSCSLTRVSTAPYLLVKNAGMNSKLMEAGIKAYEKNASKTCSKTGGAHAPGGTDAKKNALFENAKKKLMDPATQKKLQRVGKGLLKQAMKAQQHESGV